MASGTASAVDGGGTGPAVCDVAGNDNQMGTKLGSNSTASNR
jgi:hypothetical protein